MTQRRLPIEASTRAEPSVVIGRGPNGEPTFQLAPHSARVAAGAHAKRRGEKAEEIVGQLHERADFRALYPGLSLLRRWVGTSKEKGQTTYVGEQGPDFGGGGPARLFGSSADVGLWVEVEVKACDPREKKHLPFARFTDCEIRTLTACRSAGGIAVVLVLHGPAVGYATWCSIPWVVLEPRILAWKEAVLSKAPGRVKASIADDEMLSFAVRRPEDYLRSAADLFAHKER